MWGKAKATFRVKFIVLTILLKIKDWKGLTESFVLEARKGKTSKKVRGINWCIRKKKNW